MAYEHNPNSGTLFKNDRKVKDSQPDYKGSGKDKDGNDIWISAWIKKSANGSYMSLSFQPKDGEEPKEQTRGGGGAGGFSDEIPFSPEWR